MTRRALFSILAAPFLAKAIPVAKPKTSKKNLILLSKIQKIYGDAIASQFAEPALGSDFFVKRLHANGLVEVRTLTGKIIGLQHWEEVRNTAIA